MKRFIGLLAVVMVSAVPHLAKSEILTEWTFDTSGPTAFRAPGVWLTNITAEIGSGTASALHSTFTTYSGYPGNGSFDSFGATNGWSVGDFYQFALSTAGHQNVSLSFDQEGAAEGPSTFFFEYSTDGNTFTRFGSDYTVAVGNWNTSTRNLTTSFGFNLSSVSALNDQSVVYFRIVDDSAVAIDGGPVEGYADDRIDNFLVLAQPIPEPAALAFVLLGGILLVRAQVCRLKGEKYVAPELLNADAIEKWA